MTGKGLKNGSFGRSFLCAFRGLATGMEERNLKIHLTVFILVMFFGALFNLSDFEWLIIFMVSGAVFSVELVNTAVEEVCDRLRDDLGLSYESTRKARDIVAASVLVTAFVALLCGVVIFLPKVLESVFGL